MSRGETTTRKEKGAGESLPTKLILQRHLRLIITVGLILISTLLLFWLLDDPLQRYAAIVAAGCLILWLSETVPPFVPTLLLIPAVAVVFTGEWGSESLGRVLGWGANPVLALFLGGFVLSVAAARYRIDYAIAERALAISGGRAVRLIFLCAAATALLSMWISNIAAAALMLAAIRPILAHSDPEDNLRRSLLLAIAFAANVGGMATPIGSGPNGIAIASVAPVADITFVGWMGFALPLTAGMTLLTLVVILSRHRVGRGGRVPSISADGMRDGAGGVIALFTVTVLLWLTEPLHGIPSAVVALLATAGLFLTRLLGPEDLRKVDWSTLILIAGGLVLGRTLEESGVVALIADSIEWSSLSEFSLTFLLCLASATMSALMSNTASVALLVPLALSIDPSPSLAILIAVSASLGAPFVISTPPNAMIYGEGGIRFGDLAVPGIILMIGGLLLVCLTGRTVLGLLGIP